METAMSTTQLDRLREWIDRLESTSFDPTSLNFDPVTGQLATIVLIKTIGLLIQTLGDNPAEWAEVKKFAEDKGQACNHEISKELLRLLATISTLFVPAEN
jgi:hypothetical protein